MAREVVAWGKLVCRREVPFTRAVTSLPGLALSVNKVSIEFQELGQSLMRNAMEVNSLNKGSSIEPKSP